MQRLAIASTAHLLSFVAFASYIAILLEIIWDFTAPLFTILAYLTFNYIDACGAREKEDGGEANAARARLAGLTLVSSPGRSVGPSAEVKMHLWVA